MKNIKLRLRNVEIDYDNNYGVFGLTGWSVAVNGCYVAELERFLVVALWKAYFKWRRWESE